MGAISSVSGESVEEIKDSIRDNTKLIYLESPAAAVYTLQDIQAITNLAKEHGIYSIIDNTWATPIFQRTFDIGIDLEFHF